jgi:hypothetical protein
MFQPYINNLLNNLPKRDKPIHIDLVLDGGVFNGSYLIGALYFLKELEKINYVKIKRISGCSVGAAVGLLYRLNKLDYSQKINQLIVGQLKKKYKIPIVKEYKKILFENETLKESDENEILQKVNDYLFVSYHKKTKRSLLFKKNIKQKYKTIDDLFDSVLRSCFVPFLIDGNMLYKNKYMDGITPYIFEETNNRKILYLDLCNNDKLLHMINIKNEKTDSHRILTGILDAHLFFIKNTNTSMCSYVNDWTLMYKSHNQYKKYIFEYFAIFIMTLTNYINHNYISNTNSNELKSLVQIGKDISFIIYKIILKKCVN